MQYRFMKPGEESKICSLVENVFNELVAPDYGPEGINEFFRFADPDALAGRSGQGQVVVVAEQGTEIAGVIEILNHDHIAMLFVSRRGKGIAKKLAGMAIETCRRRRPGLSRITVNASTYAVPVYQRMGFDSTGPKQEKNGIVFVPMACTLK